MFAWLPRLGCRCLSGMCAACSAAAATLHMSRASHPLSSPFSLACCPAQMAALQIEGLVELGHRYWVPTGPEAMHAQLLVLSRGDDANIISGMVRMWWEGRNGSQRCSQAALCTLHEGEAGGCVASTKPSGIASMLPQITLPGLQFPLPIALVRRDEVVHTVFVSMHEAMAVHSEYRFAVAGPAIAAAAASQGTPASAAALVHVLQLWAQLLDSVEAALCSLPHL